MDIWLLFGILFVLLLVLAIMLHLCIAGLFSVPWVRTNTHFASKMLELADLQKKDQVLDLGSGDGAIVIEAARQGGTGIGIEQLRVLIALSELRARLFGYQNQTQFIQGDIFSIELPEADIITCYLSTKVNTQMESRLRQRYKTGTVIVSRDFIFPTFDLVKTHRAGNTMFYLYRL